MKVTLDFSEVNNNDALPEGRYRATIDQIELRGVKPETPGYLNWQFSIEEGQFVGRKVWMMTSLKTAALWKLAQSFKALGLQIQNVDLEIDEGTNLLVEPNLMGQSVFVDVTQETYQGRQQNRVDTIYGIEAVAN
jgi:hypothetical protein